METILTSLPGEGDTTFNTMTEQTLTEQTLTDQTLTDESLAEEAVTSTTPAAQETTLSSAPRISQVPTPDLSALAGADFVDALRTYILARLDEEKVSDVVSIGLEGKSEIADTMVIASGRSARHVSAAADKLVQSLKQAGLQDIKIEGQPACDWVLIDAGDVIVHLFRPEVREFYNLERIWSETARAPVSPDGVVKN